MKNSGLLKFYGKAYFLEGTLNMRSWFFFFVSLLTHNFACDISISACWQGEAEVTRDERIAQKKIV